MRSRLRLAGLGLAALLLLWYRGVLGVGEAKRRKAAMRSARRG